MHASAAENFLRQNAAFRIPVKPLRHGPSFLIYSEGTKPRVLQGYYPPALKGSAYCQTSIFFLL